MNTWKLTAPPPKKKKQQELRHHVSKTLTFAYSTNDLRAFCPDLELGHCNKIPLSRTCPILATWQEPHSLDVKGDLKAPVDHIHTNSRTVHTHSNMCASHHYYSLHELSFKGIFGAIWPVLCCGDATKRSHQKQTNKQTEQNKQKR